MLHNIMYVYYSVHCLPLVRNVSHFLFIYDKSISVVAIELSLNEYSYIG